MCLSWNALVHGGVFSWFFTICLVIFLFSLAGLSLFLRFFLSCLLPILFFILFSQYFLLFSFQYLCSYFILINNLPFVSDNYSNSSLLLFYIDFPIPKFLEKYILSATTQKNERWKDTMNSDKMDKSVTVIRFDFLWFAL